MKPNFLQKLMAGERVALIEVGWGAGAKRLVNVSLCPEFGNEELPSANNPRKSITFE